MQQAYTTHPQARIAGAGPARRINFGCGVVTQAQVGYVSDAVTRLYTRVRDNAARAAVERLDKIRQSSNFVDVFVDEQEAEEVAAAKLLISGAGDGDRTRDIQFGKLQPTFRPTQKQSLTAGIAWSNAALLPLIEHDSEHNFSPQPKVSGSGGAP